MKSKNYLMNEHWPFAVNLGNSIIGVAILTMPFCFKQVFIENIVLINLYTHVFDYF